MTRQSNFLDTTPGGQAVRNIPEGLHYHPELIDVVTEDAVIARLRELPFKEFEFHGYTGKRRVVSFGWQYEFSGRGKLRKADDIPEFLLPLRALAANVAGVEPESFQHVLAIEYGPGAGIGWHRDKPVFGEVVGVSLLAPCVLRFRRKVVDEPGTSKRQGSKLSPRVRSSWERANLSAEPRSAYHLSGPARYEWEHSILRVDSLRYSITFRNLRAD